MKCLHPSPPPPSSTTTDPLTARVSSVIRYALLEKVRNKAIAHEERFRKDGKGFVKPWEVNPKLEEIVDPIAHKK